MTTPEEEERLQQLFDATSEEPSQPELERMARASAQIPEHAKRRLPFGLTWPRLGLALAGLAAATALVAIELGDEAAGPPAASLSPTSEGPPAVLPDADALVDSLAALSAEQDGMAWLGDDEDELPPLIGDPLNVLDGEPLPDPAAPLDLLAHPSDAELDRYIASYERILSDG